MRALTILSLLASAAVFGTTSSVAAALSLPAHSTNIHLHKVIDVTLRNTASGGSSDDITTTSVGSAHPSLIGSSTSVTPSPTTILKGKVNIISNPATFGQSVARMKTVGVVGGAGSGANAAVKTNAYTAASALFYVRSSALDGASHEALDELTAVLISHGNTVIFEGSEAAMNYLSAISNLLTTRRFHSALYVVDAAGGDAERFAQIIGDAARDDVSTDASAAISLETILSPSASSYVYFRRPAAITGNATNAAGNTFPNAIETFPAAAVTNTYIAIHNQPPAAGAGAKAPTTAKALPEGFLLTTSYDVMGVVPTLASSTSAASPATAIVGAALHRIAGTMGGASSSSSSASAAAVYGLIGHAGRFGDLSTALVADDNVITSVVNAAVAVDADLLLVGAGAASGSSTASTSTELFLHMGKDYASSTSADDAAMRTFVKTLQSTCGPKKISFTPIVTSAAASKKRQSATDGSASAFMPHDTLAQAGLKVPSLTISGASSSSAADVPPRSTLLKGAMKQKSGAVLQKSAAEEESKKKKKVSALVVDIAECLSTAIAAATPAMNAKKNAPLPFAKSASAAVADALLSSSERMDRSTITAAGLLSNMTSTLAATASSEEKKEPFGKAVDELFNVVIPNAAATSAAADAKRPRHIATESSPAVVVLSGNPTHAFANAKALDRVGMTLRGPFVVVVEAHSAIATVTEIAMFGAIVVFMVGYAVLMFGFGGAKKLIAG